MKGKMKKLFALALAAIMVLAMGITVSAQTVGTEAQDTATITINNASKGETYNVYKLFDATVTGGVGGSIIYTGDIPEGLTTFFEKDAAGNIQATDLAVTDGKVSEELETALSNWAKDAAPVYDEAIVSDGSVLKFVGLDYGYYVVTTSQGDHALTVDSTNPNASVYDKNSTVPTVPDEDGKKVENDNVSIGDTVTYTLKFTTSNYDGEGASAKKITSYIITDTLPEWLDNVTVTNIKIGDDVYKVDNSVPQFDREKKITIPWTATEESGSVAVGDSLYKNGVTVVVTYTAKVVSTDITIAGAGNENTFTLKYTTEGEEGEKEPDKSTATEIIYTYALAVKKVDQAGKALPGATFSVIGLQTAEENKGVYIVSGKTEPGGKDTVMSTDDNGILIIKGVAAGNYQVQEETAPTGYNKLTDPVPVEAVKLSTSETNYTTYLDKNGNVVNTETDVVVTYENADIAASVLPVVNMSGTILPSTGGIGTTIFYVVGGILVIGAGILLITKKRMSKSN